MNHAPFGGRSRITRANSIAYSRRHLATLLNVFSMKIVTSIRIHLLLGSEISVARR